MLEADFIPLMVPDIRKEDIEAVSAVLRSGMLVQGQKVEELEERIANYLGVSHAIAVSSGTASLHLALLALGIEKGDEVIIPAFSFIATANVVELVGATPVFVDIEIETFNINVNLIEKAITPHTKAIIPVHEFGLSCNITEICSLANKFNLKVIEDGACALGATENNHLTGSFGDIGSFSFHPRKAITSGEGGMLSTNDDKLADKLRALRNHGIEIQGGKPEYIMAGFNYRMTDFQAALISSQFIRFENTLYAKEKLAQNYYKELNNCNKLQLPHVPDNKRHSWQSFHIVLDDEINRDVMIEELKTQGIGSNLGAQCIPFQKFFQEKYYLNCRKLYPNAMKVFEQGLVLPLHMSLTLHQLRYIALKIQLFVS